MYCTNCGNKTEGAFCSFCGAGMGQTQTQYTRQTPAARNKNPLLICIIVLLVVAVGLGGYFLIRGLSGDSGGSADTGSAGGRSPVGGSPSGGSAAPSSAGSVSVGSVIEFGGYDWRVLEVRGDQALVVSEYVLEWRAYHDTPVEVTWEGSDIRSYLNGDFYNSFSSSDRARIQEVRISNDDNPWYGTDGGNDTTDNIFLLSLEEVVRYFGDSGELRNRPMDSDRDWTGDGYADWIDDRYSSERAAAELSGDPSVWWLRSPGLTPYHAAFVNNDGELYVYGYVVNIGNFGVRPALWLNL